MKPCIRCGKCCQEEVCFIGKAEYGIEHPPCPALSIEGGIATCKLYALISANQKLGGYPVGGCDADFGTKQTQGDDTQGD